MAGKNIFTSIRFFEFSKKWYFRHSKRTFKPVYLEKNCSHENCFKLRKLGFWLFFTEIVAEKFFKYFLTYKSKETNAKSFFTNLALFKFFVFRGFRFFEVCYKIFRLNQNGWIIDSEVMEFWRASRGLAHNPGASTRGERFATISVKKSQNPNFRNLTNFSCELCFQDEQPWKCACYIENIIS